jgi:flagellar biosynthesis protein FlhF
MKTMSEKEYLAVAETVDEVIDKIRKELGNDYEVVEKDTKVRYKFPFSWKKEYRYRAILKNSVDTQPKASTNKKKMLIDMLDNPKTFEKEAKETEKDEEINEIKTMLQEFQKKIQPAEVQGFLTGEKETNLKRLYDGLVANEIEEAYAKELIEEVTAKTNESEWSDLPLLKKRLTGIVKDKVNIDDTVLKQSMQTLALIGPTGVGKTTTLVKIATSLKQGDKRIGLITTDNYRVAAFEQLKEYADKLGCPMIKSEPEELYDPIDVFKYQKGMDHILVDTSGRSPMDKGLIEEIQSYLEVVQPDHVALVLSATQKYSDMLRTLNNYSDIKVNSIIFTKLDETMSFGFLHNILMKYNIPISYMTTGQEVPDDIEIATKENIAERIVNGVGIYESGV